MAKVSCCRKIPGRSLRGGRPESPVPGFSCPSPLVWCLSGASPEYHRRIPGVSGQPVSYDEILEWNETPLHDAEVLNISFWINQYWLLDVSWHVALSCLIMCLAGNIASEMQFIT